jgi:hypothetical protein
MATKELHEKAQDRCLGAIAAEILSLLEARDGTGFALVREIGKQAQRIMRTFGVVAYPGLPSLDYILTDGYVI